MSSIAQACVVIAPLNGGGDYTGGACCGDYNDEAIIRLQTRIADGRETPTYDVVTTIEHHQMSGIHISTEAYRRTYCMRPRAEQTDTARDVAIIMTACLVFISMSQDTY